MADTQHEYKFNVSMSCGGCSGAIERVLKKLEGTVAYITPHAAFLPASSSSRWRGVKSYNVNLEAQTATVLAEPSLAYDTVLSTIKKTGKTVNSGEADGVQKEV
ncbi:hypothetical protein AJ78_00785 [Emergomyces pasteurianus Ep9510]|uniref:Uncharacterized protein n=1 Tax=Emergomyces pasteurianus Ep9510 TaxID=1447872 RepID=A0A1J9QSS6_9EURO|nr:hypothetical protein AJ78_00785 [Emergomyces pasteurianus Ep9510]